MTPQADKRTLTERLLVLRERIDEVIATQHAGPRRMEGYMPARIAALATALRDVQGEADRLATLAEVLREIEEERG